MATFLLALPATGSSVDPDQWLFTTLVEGAAAFVALFGVVLVVLSRARPSPVRRPAPSPGSAAAPGMRPPGTPSRPQPLGTPKTGGISQDSTSKREEP